MAVTRITAMHLNKGRTIAQCLKDRTDYAKNPGKSERCLFYFCEIYWTCCSYPGEQERRWYKRGQSADTIFP